MKPKIYYFRKLKTVKRLSNKLIEKQKKRWNINSKNQDKHFISVQIYRFKDLGC